MTLGQVQITSLLVRKYLYIVLYKVESVRPGGADDASGVPRNCHGIFITDKLSKASAALTLRERLII
jgi:hypothetical protein